MEPEVAAQAPGLDGAPRIATPRRQEAHVELLALAPLERSGERLPRREGRGVEALEVLEHMERPVDLIVTDVMMPLMDGPSLIKKVREKWPTIKVICISGYAEESFRDKIGSWDDIWFLPKPYSLNQLAGLVKDAIGAGKRAA